MHSLYKINKIKIDFLVFIQYWTQIESIQSWHIKANHGKFIVHLNKNENDITVLPPFDMSNHHYLKFICYAKLDKKNTNAITC